MRKNTILALCALFLIGCKPEVTPNGIDDTLEDNIVLVSYAETGVQVKANTATATLLHIETKATRAKIQQAADMTAPMTYILSASATEGSFRLEATSPATIVLNNVALSTTDKAPLNIHNTALTTLRLADGTSSSLTTSAPAQKGIKVNGDLLVDGTGSLSITTMGDGQWDELEAGTDAASCIKVKGHLTINSGALVLTSGGSGGKGINCDSVLTINGGNIAVATTGEMYIYEGFAGDSTNIPDSLRTSPKGVKGEAGVVINDGYLRISTAADGGEGLESKATLVINGGTIEINAFDDCINSFGDMTINGGRIYVSSLDNDGIDSNYNLFINGGTIVAYGAPFRELGIDVNDRGPEKKFYLSGGTLFAVGGSKDVSKPFTSESMQPAILYNGQIEQGATLLLSCEGAGIWAATQERNYTAEGDGTTPPRLAVLISSPDLVVGSSYLLYGGATVSGNDWHSLIALPTIAERGTQIGRVTSLEAPCTTAKTK